MRNPFSFSPLFRDKLEILLSGNWLQPFLTVAELLKQYRDSNKGNNRSKYTESWLFDMGMKLSIKLDYFEYPRDHG